MEYTIKSKHPLKPPADADALERRLFWHWACLRRNTDYQALYRECVADCKGKSNDDLKRAAWKMSAWHHARLPVMIDPAWDEQRLIRYVRTTDGAAEWRRDVGMRPEGSPQTTHYTSEKGVWHEDNPEYGGRKSADWGAIAAELNDEGETKIFESEWDAIRNDLKLLEILANPKRRAKLRASVEKLAAGDAERVRVLRILDNPEQFKRTVADWLESHAVMDFCVRTDWKTERILDDVRLEIERVKRWRKLASGREDARVSRQSKRKKASDVDTIAEDLRIWDLAKVIEKRDGTTGVAWSKLAREAYPNEVEKVAS